jgi:SRSO17 transposase
MPDSIGCTRATANRDQSSRPPARGAQVLRSGAHQQGADRGRGSRAHRCPVRHRARDQWHDTTGARAGAQRAQPTARHRVADLAGRAARQSLQELHSGSGTRVSNICRGTRPGSSANIAPQESGNTISPAETSLRTLAAIIKARWICEQAHQQMKAELGLDHFGDGPGKAYTDTRS